MGCYTLLQMISNLKDIVIVILLEMLMIAKVQLILYFYLVIMLFHEVQRNNQLLHSLHVNQNILLQPRVHVTRYGYEDY